MKSFLVFLADQTAQQLWADGAKNFQEVENGIMFVLNNNKGFIDAWGRITWIK